MLIIKEICLCNVHELYINIPLKLRFIVIYMLGVINLKKSNGCKKGRRVERWGICSINYSHNILTSFRFPHN